MEEMYGSLQTFKDEDPKDPGRGGPGRDPDDSDYGVKKEVYIFVSKDKKGIYFVDQSPDGLVAKLTGTTPDRVFITNASAVSEVDWNDNVNKPNVSRKVLYMDGHGIVSTYMVSESKFYEIQKAIAEAKEKSDTTVRIDATEEEFIKDYEVDINKIKMHSNSFNEINKEAIMHSNEINIPKETIDKFKEPTSTQEELSKLAKELDNSEIPEINVSKNDIAEADKKEELTTTEVGGIRGLFAKIKNFFRRNHIK